jgi:hypothetical protein
VLGSLGRSAQGRDIPYLLFTKEGLSDAGAVVALGRPILWFIGFQHGNEPAGYVLLGEAGAAADRLALDMVAVCALAAPASIEAETFVLKGAVKRVNRESINPDQSVDVERMMKSLALPAGTRFVPMNQPAAGLAAAALEPDSPGSFIGTGIVPMPTGGNEAPIYRADEAAARSLRLTPLRGVSVGGCGPS